jgi:predicted SAM-dependent methyltransferase
MADDIAVLDRETVPHQGIDVAPLKLDLGCGRHKRGPEWVGVDTHTRGADIDAPMWAVPLPDGCADELYSSHALEHVRKAQVIPTLLEWRRLARPGATLTLRVPDLAWCVRNWLATGMGNGWELDTIFGSQEHAGNCHRTGFTAPMLRFYLRQAGWSVVSERAIESHGQPTIEVVCRCA